MLNCLVAAPLPRRGSGAGAWEPKGGWPMEKKHTIMLPQSIPSHAPHRGHNHLVTLRGKHWWGTLTDHISHFEGALTDEAHYLHHSPG